LQDSRVSFKSKHCSDPWALAEDQEIKNGGTSRFQVPGVPTDFIIFALFSGLSSWFRLPKKTQSTMTKKHPNLPAF